MTILLYYNQFRNEDPGIATFIIIMLLAVSGYIFTNSLLTGEFFRRDKLSASPVLIQRFTGALIFSIISFSGMFLFRDHFPREYLIPGWQSLLYALLVLPVVLVINYLNSSRPQNLEMYPQIRVQKWSWSLLTVSALSWVIYLVCYELLIRGVIFGISLAFMGLWPAIIINTVIYFAIHLQKGIKEATGAIPFGILLCYVTFVTGSIWFAVFVHIMLALSNEWFSIYFHPGIGLKGSFK